MRLEAEMEREAAAAWRAERHSLLRLHAVRAEEVATARRGHEAVESQLLAVESVQSTIVELGGIFDQLRVMVAEQGSEMQRVDENVDDALSNVEQGHQQLLRYWRRVSSNQGLMIRVFAVLMFFVVLFGTVM